jgi:hypothetical protein
VIAHALAALEPDRLLVYLDADAICLQRIDELLACPFDVAVTDRDHWDLAKTAVVAEYIGQFNAGVIVFRKSARTAAFVEQWARATDELGNDQRALNAILNPDRRRITAGAEFAAAGVAVRVFDGMIYNNRERPTRFGIKVVHFKRERWRELLATGESPAPPSTIAELVPRAIRWYAELVYVSAYARLGEAATWIRAFTSRR